MCRRLPVCHSLQHHQVTRNDNSNSKLVEIALEEGRWTRLKTQNYWTGYLVEEVKRRVNVKKIANSTIVYSTYTPMFVYKIYGIRKQY